MLFQNNKAMKVIIIVEGDFDEMRKWEILNDSWNLDITEITPPTEEEIERYANNNYEYEQYLSFMEGAEWMLKKLGL